MNSFDRPEAFPAISSTDAAPAPAPARMEIIFIDGKAPNYRQLIGAAQPGIELHVLDGSNDGLAEMVQVLAGRSHIAAIHIIGNGKAGLLQLGSTTLTSANLEPHAVQLHAIGAALAPDGNILLYGCYAAPSWMSIDVWSPPPRLYRPESTHRQERHAPPGRREQRRHVATDSALIRDNCVNLMN
jgi:hypothetical protein